MLGDTNTSNPEVQDESINFFLVTQGKSVTQAAIACAWAIAGKYASVADVNVDDQLTKYSEVYKHWVDLARRLEAGGGDAFEPLPDPANTSAGSGIIVNGVGDCRGPLDDCCYRW